MANIIIGCFFSIFYFIGILFCCGYGGTLLGGYHFQPKSKGAMKYHKKLMLRLGIGFIVVSACVHISIVCAINKKFIAFGILLVSSIVLAILGIIYINTSKTVKTLMRLEKEEEKANEKDSKEE